jgi:uncharacterized protein
MQITLSPDAIRALGCLIEKELSTPEYYPLTVNALKAACNQKSNRNPVVQFSETDLITAIDELMHHRIVGQVTGGGSRAVKYRHALVEAWGLSRSECAALACLALRGPQTVGEIKGRTERLYPFRDLEETQQTLSALISREEPLVVLTARRPGQKEARYAHLLSGSVDEIPDADVGESDAHGSSLHEKVESLAAALAELRTEFDSFRKQFE